MNKRAQGNQSNDISKNVKLLETLYFSHFAQSFVEDGTEVAMHELMYPETFQLDAARVNSRLKKPSSKCYQGVNKIWK